MDGRYSCKICKKRFELSDAYWMRTDERLNVYCYKCCAGILFTPVTIEKRRTK